MDFLEGNLYVDLPPCKYDVFDYCHRDCQSPEVCEHCLLDASKVIDAGYRKLCREEKEFFKARLLQDIKKHMKGDNKDG